MKNVLKNICSFILILYLSLFITISDVFADASFLGEGNPNTGTGGGGGSTGFTGIAPIMIFNLVDTSDGKLNNKQAYYMISKEGDYYHYAFKSESNKGGTKLKNANKKYAICGTLTESNEYNGTCQSFEGKEFPEEVAFSQETLKNTGGIIAQTIIDSKGKKVDAYPNFNVSKLEETIIQGGKETEEYSKVVKFLLSKELGIDYNTNKNKSLEEFNQMLYNSPSKKQLQDYRVFIEPVYAVKNNDTEYGYFTSKGLAVHNKLGVNEALSVYNNLYVAATVGKVINYPSYIAPDGGLNKPINLLKKAHHGVGYAIVKLSYVIPEVKQCVIEEKSGNYEFYLEGTSYGVLNNDVNGDNLITYINECACNNADLQSNLNGIEDKLNEIGKERYENLCGEKKCKIIKSSTGEFTYYNLKEEAYLGPNNGIGDPNGINLKYFLDSSSGCGCTKFNSISTDIKNELRSLYGEALFDEIYGDKCVPKYCEIVKKTSGEYVFYNSVGADYDNDIKGDNFKYFLDSSSGCGCELFKSKLFSKYKDNLLTTTTSSGKTLNEIYNEKCNSCEVTLDPSTLNVSYIDSVGKNSIITVSDGIDTTDANNFRHFIQSCGCTEFNNNYSKLAHLLKENTPDGRTLNDYYGDECSYHCDIKYDSVNNKYIFYDNKKQELEANETNFEHLINESVCNCNVVNKNKGILSEKKYEDIYNSKCVNSCTIKFDTAKSKYMIYGKDGSEYVGDESNFDHFLNSSSKLDCGCSYFNSLDNATKDYFKNNYPTVYNNRCGAKATFDCEGYSNIGGEIINGTIDFPSNENIINKFCKFECKENLVIKNIEDTTNRTLKAGQFYTLSDPLLTATKTCEIDIKYNDWFKEYKDAVEEFVDKYNEWKKYSKKGIYYKELPFDSVGYTDSSKTECKYSFGSITGYTVNSDAEITESSSIKVSNITFPTDGGYCQYNGKVGVNFDKSQYDEDKEFWDDLANAAKNEAQKIYNDKIKKLIDDLDMCNNEIKQLGTENFYSLIKDNIKLNFSYTQSILENDKIILDSTDEDLVTSELSTEKICFGTKLIGGMKCDFPASSKTSINVLKCNNDTDCNTESKDVIKDDFINNEVSETKSFMFTVPTKYVQPLIGIISKSSSSGFIELGKGYSTNLAAQIKDDNKNVYTLTIDETSETGKAMKTNLSSNSYQRTCSYKISNEIVECKEGHCDKGRESKLLVKYKIIDPSNMDPNDRINSDGFKNYRSNEAIAVMDKIEKDAKEGNTFHPDKIEYSFTLDPNIIQTIKDYNKKYKYIDKDDLNLKCETNGTKCISEFITNSYEGKDDFYGNAFGNYNIFTEIYGRSTWKEINITDEVAKKYEIDGEEFISDYEFTY